MVGQLCRTAFSSLPRTGQRPTCRTNAMTLGAINPEDDVQGDELIRGGVARSDIAVPASRTRQANFPRSRICPSVDWSSVLTLGHPTTAMIRSMLKVWQAGLPPWSCPLPDYPRRRNFQALRLPTTGRLKASVMDWNRRQPGLFARPGRVPDACPRPDAENSELSSYLLISLDNSPNGCSGCKIP